MTIGWVDDGADITVPSPARVSNYALGGMHNVAADRAFWHTVLAAYPAAEQIEHANRAFLRETVGRLLDTGVRQFLDLGAGIPVIDGVHELIHEHDVTARVVYADLDPVTVELTNRLLSGHPRAFATHGDCRRPAELLDQTAHLLDLDRPVAVLAAMVLQFLPADADCVTLLDRIAGDVADGSYLVISHPIPEAAPAARAGQEAARRLYDRTPTPMVLRRPDEITALLDGPWQPLPPGLTTTDRRHHNPDDDLTCPPSLLTVIARRRPGSRAPTAAATRSQPPAGPSWSAPRGGRPC